MAIVKTTISAAVSAGATLVNLTSATGASAPGPNKVNRTIILVDREFMEITTLNGTVASVVRGVWGSLRVAHSIGAQVYVGLEADFSAFLTSAGLGNLAGMGGIGRAYEVRNILALADTATMTPAQVMGGVINGTPTAAANYTLPTPALLFAALQSFGNLVIGSSFEFIIRNTSAGANTITVVGVTGATVVGTATIAQNQIKRFLVIVTSVDLFTYSVYSEGTSAF